MINYVKNKSEIMYIIGNSNASLIDIPKLIKIYHKHFPLCTDFKGKMRSLWPYHSRRVLCKRIRTVSKSLIRLLY